MPTRKLHSKSEPRRHASSVAAAVDIELSEQQPLNKKNNNTPQSNQNQSNQKAPLLLHSQHLLQPNGSIRGSAVAAAILPRFASLLDALPMTENPALYSVNAQQRSLRHYEIRAFLQKTGDVLHDELKMGRGSRVAVILPNGPELALALLAVSCYCTCVPLNANAASQELRADVKKAAIDCIWGLSQETQALAASLEISYCELIPQEHVAGGYFALRPVTPHTVYQRPKHERFFNNSSGTTFADQQQLQQQFDNNTVNSEADRSAGLLNTALSGEAAAGEAAYDEQDRFRPNGHNDQVLVLFTSGTTGTKKLVPHFLSDILVASACIAVSWKLDEHDVNCNLMPLFHIGGQLRNIFAVVLSGGSVICCPDFDPDLFWQLLPRFTWYYAAPTLHQLILQTGRKLQHIEGSGDGSTTTSGNNNNNNNIMDSINNKNKKKPHQKEYQLRMIANAAGGLLPSLARELRQAFHANILPSYGMTECMPITSPPAHYQLEKPGTSGVAVGPEVAILNLSDCSVLQTGKEGPICVRSAPCFRGYGMICGETSAAAAASPASETFLKDGWFNTGDLGYMDSDGYLYITGRSKEVINRGGEIISPLEVEEAVLQHPSVTACVAFSTKHSVLQEVVGLLLVVSPDTPRIDLPALHEYLGQGRLAAPKWPQCLVYMDAVPKSFTNKLLRVKLGKRLGLPELNDNMYNIERTFQAKCPPIGAPVSVAIPCERVSVNAGHVQNVLRETFPDLVVTPHPSKIGALVVYVGSDVDRLAVVKTAQLRLDAYAVPSHVVVCLSGSPSEVLLLDEDMLHPPQSSDAIGSILQEESRRGLGPADPLVMELQELMQVMLDLDCLPSPDTNFFNLGGSSMLASQLASKIRKLHSVPFGGAEVFHISSCSAMAGVIRERQSGQSENASENESNPASMAASSLFSLKLDLSKMPFEAGRLETHNGYLGILFQLLPLFVVYPTWQATRFFLFFRFLLWVLQTVPGEGNILRFIFTIVIFHGMWMTITPLFFVLCKWVIIGKYRKGRYPLWGEYYLRWWFVDILRRLIGLGVWGEQPDCLNFYYRLLGASVGKDARISPQAEIAEFDLVSIGEGARVELSTVRGFGVDNGSMILGNVGVGNHASVGLRSVVAPYTFIPESAHLSPVSSSYEVSSAIEPNSDSTLIKYNRQAFKEASKLSQAFVVGPVSFFVTAMSYIPALGILFWMVSMPWHRNEPFETIGDLVEWLADPRRIPFYLGIRIARSILAPMVYMACAILVKRCIIGKFEPGPRDTNSEWQLIRHELAATLFSRENMQEVTDIIGRHYGLVSSLYRLLGAKVGRRVFWPGQQPIFTGEFDLLEIGDDVVFGSRATLICTTADSCEKIILCAGANISDNTVVLPGSIVGKGAVLGSNSMCPAGRYLPESSVWLGARSGQPVLLEKGTDETINGPIQASEISTDELQLDGDESTLRPFGKAVYHGEASYFVWPLFLINLFTLANRIFVATLASLPIIGALHLAAGFLYGWPMDDRSYQYTYVTSSSLFMAVGCFLLITHFFHVVVWSILELLSFKCFIGRREEGRHNWDMSTYGQNWELYQLITHRIRDLGRLNFFDLIAGSPYIVSFFRMLGCKIGNDCCLFPSGGDPYLPEPDLVEMGDRCVIDCAAVVCHLNTRGNFELAKITMQNNVTLRTRARIQQAVHMESGSMLLEKSLAMTGEVIESDSVWLGAPAARLLSYDTSSIGTRLSGSYAGSHNGSHGGEFV